MMWFKIILTQSEVAITKDFIHFIDFVLIIYNRENLKFVALFTPDFIFNMSRLVGKPTMWFPNRSGTNQAV